MKINSDNYELFFINYFDGNLKPEEIEQLMSFLKQNPALEDEFHNFNTLNIDIKETICFENKNTLKKNISDKIINTSNIDEFLIAYIENDLSPSEITRLNKFLEANPSHKKDLEIYRNAFLKPDLNITYSEKGKLKKQIKPVVRKLNYFYYSIVAAAACLLLFFNIFFSDDINYGMKSKNKDNYLEAGLSNIFFNNNNDHAHDTVNTIAVNTINNERTTAAPPFNIDYIRIEQKPPKSIITHNNNTAHISDIRNEYSSIFNLIQESEYKTEEETYADIIPEQKESFLQYAANKLFNKNDDKNSEGNNKIDLWQVVDIGTYGINSLADNNLIDIKRTQDKNTTKTDFALGGNVIYSRTSSKNKVVL